MERESAAEEKKTGRPRYERPLARDLSAFSVSGDREPTGICIFGSQPAVKCNLGFGVHRPETCHGGFLPIGSCNPGGSPVGVCFPGSVF